MGPRGSDGAAGRDGPPGPTGATGPQGPAGPDRIIAAGAFLIAHAPLSAGFLLPAADDGKVLASDGIECFALGGRWNSRQMSVYYLLTWPRAPERIENIVPTGMVRTRASDESFRPHWTLEFVEPADFFESRLFRLLHRSLGFPPLPDRGIVVRISATIDVPAIDVPANEMTPSLLAQLEPYAFHILLTQV